MLLLSKVLLEQILEEKVMKVMDNYKKLKNLLIPLQPWLNYGFMFLCPLYALVTSDENLDYHCWPNLAFELEYERLCKGWREGTLTDPEDRKNAFSIEKYYHAEYRILLSLISAFILTLGLFVWKGFSIGGLGNGVIEIILSTLICVVVGNIIGIIFRKTIFYGY